MRRRSSAAAMRTNSASRSRRVSAPRFSKCAESAPRFEEKSDGRTFALANAARGGTFFTRREGGDGTNIAPHGDDAASDVSSARAMSSPLREKQVRSLACQSCAATHRPPAPPSHCTGLTTTSHRSPRVLLLHRYRRWYLQRRVPSGRTPPTTTTPRHHRRLPLSGGGDARTVAVQRRRVRSEARSKARQRYRRCHPLHRAMRRRFRGSARCLPPPPISSKLSVGRARTHPRRYQEVLAAQRAR